jgi:hypothetical protein
VIIPTPEDLHVRADALWRRAGAEDSAAERYARAAWLILHGRPVSHRRAANWVSTLHRYEDHWREAGRAPRENTRAKSTLPDDERNLGEWARYQRRFEDRLNAYQRARLDVSPAFDWDPLEHIWHQRFDACVVFLEQTGALPRLNAEDTAEFALARWLGRQLHRLQTGRLDKKRTDALHRLLRLRKPF